MATDFSGLGQGVSDIFGGLGDLSEASGYSEAASLAQKNASLVALSSNIQEEQETRQSYQTEGALQADVGANGLALGGSDMDVLKSNAQQLSLNKNLNAEQALIDSLGWEEKAQADTGMASAAQASAGGGFLSGILSIGAALL